MTEMNCRQTIEALMDYLEARQTHGARAALEAHLANCPRCVEFLKAYRAVAQIVRRATEIELPSPLEARLRARITAALGGGS